MYKRIIAVFTAFCFGFGCVCLRLYTLTTQVDAASYLSSHYKKVNLDTLRLPILDTNGNAIVNSETENFVVAKPNEGALAELYKLLPQEQFDKIATPILQGSIGYVCVEKSYYPQTLNYITLSKNVRYSSSSVATHLVGYVNSDGDGVSGIERCFNSLLKTDISLYAGFLCDVKGRVVEGAEIQTDFTYNNHRGAVNLTVDKTVQTIVEEQLKASTIKRGAVIVSDVKTGEIKALASLPSYDPNNVEKVLQDEASPLTNRALSAYSVGSVFKVVVSASALENGIDKSEIYNCSGEITVEKNIFHCNNSTAHGNVNMEKALEQSCNCYFISLAQELGGKKILETAKAMGFGESIEIAKNLHSQNGILPNEKDLQSLGSLANFSFGQGKFTATPVQMLNVINSIANGGKYVKPYCVKNVTDIDGNDVYDFKPKAPVYAISKNTADELRKMMISVVKNGTAKNAQTQEFISAGKTATAQTGIYNENGEELCTWFMGFFPADNPQNSVIVISENGTTGGNDCAPVYKAIAQRIFEREKTESSF